MSVIGRFMSYDMFDFQRFERPLLVRADVPMKDFLRSASEPKADIV